MFSILTVFCCVFVATFALTITRDGYYDTKYNHLDIERVLNNKRLVTYYGQCLLGEGPCTPQGTEFKRILPEALTTNCVRCTEKQKVTAYLAIRRLKKEYPKIWQKLQAAWDPTGEHVSRFVNHVETSSKLEGISRIGNSTAKEVDVSNNQIPNVIVSRFGEENEENEININSSPQTPQTKAPVPSSLPLSAPTSNNIQFVDKPSSTSSTTTQERSTERTIQTTTTTNYRNTYRPNRIQIMLPRPIDLSKFTANVFAQVADVGTKVIRTGARIADMVLSGVQASVRPIFANNNNNNRA